jgi:hypothetical protein
MGGSFDEHGTMASCDGQDVIDELNKVFGDTSSSGYLKAQAKKDLFKNIPNGAGNYQALIDAYNTVGVPVRGGWLKYLTLLGSVQPQGPDNIYAIAQFRYENLDAGLPMETVVHVPKHGGHVHTRRGSKAGLGSQVDSPCPMPGKITK